MKKRVPVVISLWSITVIAFSIIDVILMCLLARDYASCKDDPTNAVYFLVNGVGLTLAARGFILWIFNVTTAGVMLHFGLQVREYYFKIIFFYIFVIHDQTVTNTARKIYKSTYLLIYRGTFFT